MFSRRHPILFFILMFSGMWALTIVTVSTFFFLASTKSDDYSYGDNKVGIVEVTGVIQSSSETVKALRDFRDNSSVKAVVLRVNSPGGGVGPSQEIYREVMRTKQVKPVIASFGSLAASGGYYIASPATGIVTNPGTLTGSIGVIMGFTNFQELMEKIGLKPIIIKSGEYKAMGSPFKEMTEEEHNLLQTLTTDIHKQFIDHVAEGRNMDAAKVAEIADGRVLTGIDALKLGLCDRIGNMEDAVEWAGKMGGITGKIHRVFPEEDEEYPFIDKFIRSSMKSLAGYVEEYGLKNLGPEYRFQP